MFMLSYTHKLFLLNYAETELVKAVLQYSILTLVFVSKILARLYFCTSFLSWAISFN